MLITLQGVKNQTSQRQRSNPLGLVSFNFTGLGEGDL